MVYRGKISGSVAESFLARDSVEGAGEQAELNESYSLTLMAMWKTEPWGSGVDVSADGTFSMTLPAGTYDLFLELCRNGGKLLRRLPVETGFVVGENEHRLIRLE